MILNSRLNLQKLSSNFFCRWINFVFSLFFLLSRGWFLWFPNHFLVWNQDNEQVSVSEVFALFSRKLQRYKTSFPFKIRYYYFSIYDREENEDVTSPTSVWKRLRSSIAIFLNSFSLPFMLTITLTWVYYRSLHKQSDGKELSQIIKGYKEQTLSPSCKNFCAALRRTV